MRYDTASADYYRQLLEDLYAGIERLDVTGYRWDESDGWRQSRGELLSGLPGLHLETWIDLGGVGEIRGSDMVHESSAIYAVRYQDDDDSLSQAILHASTRALMLHLLTWARPDGVRTSPQGSRIETAAHGWLVVTVTFQTRIPWRP